jgi:His-Xaa-Ser system protein HxsD
MKHNFEIIDNAAVIKINKEIYTKEVIIQATYVKLEEAYFLIDQKEEYFLINIKLKDNTKLDLKDTVYSFFDELIESQSYIDQLKRTSKIREIILERALLGQTLDDETIESLNLDK